jgi:TPR repeat protein
MKPPKPGPRAAELFERGNQAQAEGDVSGARRYYLVAAEQGSPQAASRLGQLYDPTYLKQTAIGGIDPDPALARKWYERAVELGDAQAKSLLNALAER